MAARDPRRGRGRRRRDAGVVRLPDGRELPIRDVLRPASAGSAASSSGSARRARTPSRTTRSAGAPAFFEFNCTAIEAEVDRETGDMTIVRHVIVSDVGKAINPLQVRMQDEGAAIQGLGHTLMEQYIFDDEGRVRNLGAIDYRIPTSMDLPLRDGQRDRRERGRPGPYGAKGMSEGALLCVAAAVGGAVSDATGVVIRDLPLTPERVWRALQRAAGASRRSDGGGAMTMRHRRVGPIGDMPAEQVVEGGRPGPRGPHDLAGRDAASPACRCSPATRRSRCSTPSARAASGSSGRQPWGPVNDVGLGYMAEYLMCTSHSGAHIDALAHMTVGEDMHWYGGGRADEHLTDHGPIFGDASQMPPMFTRGVLLDVPTYRGVLPAPGEPVDAAEIDDIARPRASRSGRGTSSSSAPGYMSLWPDVERMAAHKTAGPDLSAAHWLLDRGVVATGTDTETYEVQPAPDPGPRATRSPSTSTCSSTTASTSWRASTSRSWRASASTSSPSSPCPSRSAAPRPRWSTRSPPSSPRPLRPRRPSRSALPETMQALVVLEPSRFEIREVPVPEPGPIEVLAGCARCPSAAPTPTSSPATTRASGRRPSRSSRATSGPARSSALGPGAERSAGRSATGWRAPPRRLRRLPEMRRGPLQPLRELRQGRAPPPVRPQRPGRRRDVRRPRREVHLPAARRR